MTMDRVHDGQVANMVLRDLKNKVYAKEDAILKGLIRDYNSNKIEPSKFIAGIAQIAALRSLLDDYQRKVTQGIEAMEDAHARA